ncbi:hypothetical protein J0S82_017932 [Galemys pyrenaicus]|uniref:Uncharacterized protein n=1 Tax=Galemys pyrenaicus TaxID=202257 RepID=A0A8J6AIF1_GALPY|nr:hypothetical protein J0S82_017932 [Galemys pyrenaicus]
MPPPGTRAAVLLLPPLLLLRAVLAVPLERAAPKEESPATESPVSGPALLSSQVFAAALQFPRTPVAPGWIRPRGMELGVRLPFLAVPGL